MGQQLMEKNRVDSKVCENSRVLFIDKHEHLICFLVKQIIIASSCSESEFLQVVCYTV